MTEKVVRKSLADQVYSLIIEEIRNGELKPGERIKIEELSKKFDVSRTPLREAISRLVQNGFIESRHNVGPSIAVFDSKKVSDIIEANAFLNNDAVKIIFSSPIRREWSGELQNVVDEQKSAYMSGDTQLFFRKSMLFHETVVNECQNLKLKQLALDVQTQLGIWVLQYQESEAVKKESISVHQELVKLLEQNELDEFVKLLWMHNQQPLEYYKNIK